MLLEYDFFGILLQDVRFEYNRIVTQKCYITPTKVWLKNLCTKFFSISIDLVRINSDLPGPHDQKVCAAKSGYPNLECHLSL